MSRSTGWDAPLYVPATEEDELYMQARVYSTTGPSFCECHAMCVCDLEDDE